MDAPFQLAAVSPADFALIALVAFAASILGGLAGYGTGLVLPIFLAPVIGVANVVPVMAVGMVLNNGSRVIAFRDAVEWPHVRRILLFGVPACIAGAYGYTLLEGRTIALLIGLFLIFSVPLRRWLRHVDASIRPNVERGAGALFGFINGGMTGAGTVLIAILMAAGVQGAGLIATDALVSIVMGLTKVAMFGSLARLPADLALAGLAIGMCTIPGAFVARWLLRHIPMRIHTAVMEVIVLIGGAGFVWRAVRG